MEIVEFLVSRGVKPDERDEKGQTPLAYAEEKGKKGIVQALLNLDTVDPDSNDLEGKSPFYYAVLSGNDSIAKILADDKRVDRSIEGKAKEDRPTYEKTRPILIVEEV
jgi:ankyrin repeat protein